MGDYLMDGLCRVLQYHACRPNLMTQNCDKRSSLIDDLHTRMPCGVGWLKASHDTTHYSHSFLPSCNHRVERVKL